MFPGIIDAVREDRDSRETRDLQIWKTKLDAQRFTASNRLILTVFAGIYVSLVGETNKLRHRSSLKTLPRVSLSRELTRGRYDDCCCSTFATHFLGL